MYLCHLNCIDINNICILCSLNVYFQMLTLDTINNKCILDFSDDNAVNDAIHVESEYMRQEVPAMTDLAFK